MSYSALLACHLAAVTLFLAGLFITGALLPGASRAGNGTGARQDELRRVARLARFVTTPALLAVWGFGSAMAVEAGWFASGWLRAKLVLVLALSAWHGRQLRMLRLLVTGRPVTPGGARSLAFAVLAVGGIVVLVVAKPF